MIAAAGTRHALPHSAQSSAPRSPYGLAQMASAHVGVRPLHSDVPAISPGGAPAAGGVRAGRPSLSHALTLTAVPGVSAGRPAFSSRPAAHSSPFA